MEIFIYLLDFYREKLAFLYDTPCHYMALLFFLVFDTFFGVYFLSVLYSPLFFGKNFHLKF